MNLTVLDFIGNKARWGMQDWLIYFFSKALAQPPLSLILCPTNCSPPTLHFCL